MARASRFLLRTVKIASAAVDRFRPNVAGIVILAYHRVGGRSSLEIDLDAGMFDEQMAMVAATGSVLPLGSALERSRTDGFAHPPSVVVTFDDGTADFAEEALPVLVRHGIPVTLYLATGFVEDGVEFPKGGRPLTWPALRDACSTGLVDVGSHTHRHLLLDRAPPSEVADDLDRSTALIGDRLGRAALDFAYPKAVAGTPATAGLVRARFRSAAVAGTRANPYGATDPYDLARSPIQVSDGMRFFERKLAGGMALEDAVRRTLNRFRYAKAAT